MPNSKQSNSSGGKSDEYGREARLEMFQIEERQEGNILVRVPYKPRKPRQTRRTMAREIRHIMEPFEEPQVG
ncbi:hypothetical protein SMACR_00021 [Sordaria macrospora]|uniref:WGS project CABT00000000 data, contig 2.1 n=2 Tax=Sordaria macrospora TaxID=5147 RepID=F7VJX8_SORMK|nr:uncharacterized protein SMAC_00021 [Sordaria macrospora k-hell]KAA8629093.1 hypothetical protein SMACR_00021 [Sordaria macrospora]WPJ64574.1 hypothetical protein SMAC4_00021 [Sordaria macrospora]CCC05805.1 unnamed protein product [Sordaria macrospora k-hell]